MQAKSFTIPIVTAIMMFGLLVGTLPAAEIITEKDIVEKVVQKEDFIRTADNFIILFDSSSSMKEFVNKGTKLTKYDIVKQVLTERQKALPDLGYNAGLYIYTPFQEVYPMGPYDPAKFAMAIDSLPAEPKGRTPLPDAIREIGPVLEKLSGKTAIFVFSDGTFNELTGVKVPEVHTRELAEQHDVCFYMISSATTWQAEKRLTDMAKANACSRVIPIEAFVNNPGYMTGALYTVKASAVVETTTEARIAGLKANGGAGGGQNALDGSDIGRADLDRVAARTRRRGHPQTGVERAERTQRSRSECPCAEHERSTAEVSALDPTRGTQLRARIRVPAER